MEATAGSSSPRTSRGAPKTGFHFGHEATTRLTRPDGTFIEFPVYGRDRDEAVMSAVDQTGTAFAHFRLSPKPAGRWRSQDRNVQIVALPDRLDADALLLVLSMGAQLMNRYIHNNAGVG